jgi:hypothetical protein
MIVYTGKQYWNDFNNGDEALFEDAGLPRDSNKFKIQQWIQARKQDLRTANSGIAAQGTFHCVKSQAWQDNIIDTNTGKRLFNTAYMKNQYSASDISWLSAEDLKKLTANIIWKPYVNATDWDIVIGKSWVYSITCVVRFIAPNSYASRITSSTFSTSSAFYKFYIALLLNWDPEMWTQTRWCWWQDMLSLSLTAWYDTWDKVNVGFLHTYKIDPFTIVPEINLYRLS